MADTEIENVRHELQIFNEEVISDTSLQLFTNDANEDSKVDDERAKRYLAAYYAAKSLNWNALKSLGDGVTYQERKPEYFWELYSKRLKKLGSSVPKKMNQQCSDKYMTGDRCKDSRYDPLM